MSVIVKRRGHTEKFDQRKVYASIYSACEAAHHSEDYAEKTADHLTNKIIKWLANKKQIDAVKIRDKVKAELLKKDKTCAFYYEQHLPNLKKL
jgi:transcriptional regulator NrdR family protein